MFVLAEERVLVLSEYRVPNPMFYHFLLKKWQLPDIATWGFS